MNPTINPAHNKEILAFLLTSLGLIVLPHVSHLPFAVFGFFVSCWCGVLSAFGNRNACPVFPGLYS